MLSMYKLAIEYGDESAGMHPVTVTLYRYGAPYRNADALYERSGKSLQRLLSGAARWIAEEDKRMIQHE